MECQYCKTILKTNSALKQHQTKTKYCLVLQGKDNEKGTFICKGCNKDFHQKIVCLSVSPVQSVAVKLKSGSNILLGVEAKPKTH